MQEIVFSSEVIVFFYRFDTKSVLRQFENEAVNVDMHDTAGQEEYANLHFTVRPAITIAIMYTSTMVFFVWFDFFITCECIA